MGLIPLINRTQRDPFFCLFHYVWLLMNSETGLHQTQCAIAFILNFPGSRTEINVLFIDTQPTVFFTGSLNRLRQFSRYQTLIANVICITS